MKIAVGSDHAAFDHKQRIVEELERQGHDVTDVGTNSKEACDYPDPARKVARLVASGEAERGILCCGSGIGMSLAANKVRGIRAAVCHDEYTTTVSRTHNDSNVLCLGGRILGVEAAVRLVDIWLKTPFEGGRHQRRLDKITKIEEEECGG